MIFLLFSFLFLFFHLFFFLFSFFCFLGFSFVLDFSLFSFSWLNLNFIFSFDVFSVCFGSVVFLISSFVISYSYYYMSGIMYDFRYYSLLVLFVFSMLFLIFSPNLFSVLLGWDGLGLVSFCLIIFYGGYSVVRSGLVSIYVNRLGDAGFIACVFFFFDCMNWMDFMSWFNLSWYVYFFFVFSCFTKSAQVPFSSWLPAAMSAPTPISSLVHSSTLVTAGIYILIRFNYFFCFFFGFIFFSFFSLMTMILAGFVALIEQDMKKIIAMSTLSQLGLMMFLISIGEVSYCYFHMITHALFKSLLFLSCGGLMMMFFGDQDFRFKSNSFFFSPVFSFFFSSSSLSLGGFPFFSGFYSKDLGIDSLVEFELGFFSFVFFVFGCFLTLFYSIRIFFFGLSSNSFRYVSFNLNSNLILIIGLFFLFLFSVSFGKLIFCFFFLDEYIFSFSLLKLIGILIILFSFFSFSFFFVRLYLFFFDFFSTIFFLDLMAGWFSSKFFFKFRFFSTVDLLWLEYMGPFSLNFLLFKLSLKFVVPFLNYGFLMKLLFFLIFYFLLFSLFLLF